jgi:hypothetical protein
MDRPRVIIHNLISLDGRLDGFPADAGLYYEMCSAATPVRQLDRLRRHRVGLAAPSTAPGLDRQAAVRSE